MPSTKMKKVCRKVRSKPRAKPLRRSVALFAVLQLDARRILLDAIAPAAEAGIRKACKYDIADLTEDQIALICSHIENYQACAVDELMRPEDGS